MVMVALVELATDDVEGAEVKDFDDGFDTAELIVNCRTESSRQLHRISSHYSSH